MTKLSIVHPDYSDEAPLEREYKVPVDKKEVVFKEEIYKNHHIFKLVEMYGLPLTKQQSKTMSFSFYRRRPYTDRSWGFKTFLERELWDKSKTRKEREKTVIFRDRARHYFMAHKAFAEATPRKKYIVHFFFNDPEHNSNIDSTVYTKVHKFKAEDFECPSDDLYEARLAMVVRRHCYVFYAFDYFDGHPYLYEVMRVPRLGELTDLQYFAPRLYEMIDRRRYLNPDYKRLTRNIETPLENA